MFYGLLLVVLSNAFGIFMPKLLGMAIDALGQDRATREIVLQYAGLVILLAVLSGAARFGMRELLNGISRRIETDLRQKFFEQLLRLDATFYGTVRTGDLMSRATNDTGTVRMAAGPAVMYLVNTVVMTAFSLVFMFRISPRLAAFSLLPMVLLPPVMVYFGGKIHAQAERIQDHLGVLSTMVQENLAGARIVRAYVQERAQDAEFETLNAAYLQKNMQLARTVGMFNPLLTLLAGLGMLVVLWLGAREVMQGRISIGDFVAFGFYLSMLTWPMIALGWVINLFQRGAASMRRLNTIFALEPAVKQAAHPVIPERVRGDVEFRDVWFRYPGSERDVLRGITFDVPAGATVALVGPTGSGKTTIVSLLTRNYDPTAGAVLLDGVPLPALDLASVRAAVGVVPQDSFVFSETIAENIAFGISEDVSPNGQVREAARIARLDEAIRGFPAGYDTRLGERGVNLSGGQRQRTTLARALARNPRILVLDDSLSAVDTQTEREILTGLREVLRGRTAFIISHRVTAVMNADLILVLEAGRIVESGTHAALVEQGGLYASLLRRQMLEEGLDEERVGV
jgi:ATP-binding cassette subfamily B multidrug efflux pump